MLFLFPELWGSMMVGLNEGLSTKLNHKSSLNLKVLSLKFPCKEQHDIFP